MNNTAFGLLTINKENYGEVHAIPLLGVEVQAAITGRSCKVKVRQAYENRGKKPVEAIYKFPLPEGATICGFKAHIGDKVFSGKVEEREKAFEKYDEAVMEGDGGYLLDQDRPNIFTLRAGNLNPGMKAVLEVEYVELLESNDEEVRFFLPTTISPRYIPDSMRDVNGIPTDAIINPPIIMDVPYGLKLRLSVHDRDEIASIESPSHKIKIQMSVSPMIVELSDDTAELDRDFVVNIKYKASGVSKAFAIQKGAETFYQLDFNPQVEAKNGRSAKDADLANKEIIFLLDCSESMEGESLVQAKKAIVVFIKALRVGVHFNVYTFGSSFNKVFNESVLYNSSNVSKALNALSHIDASLGGTEIMAPLKDMLLRDGVSSLKDIIILTDGQVGNEDEVLDLVNGARKRARIFTVGIGYGPNEYFFKQVAKTTGGTFEHIAPGERIEPKVIRLLSRVTVGAVTDLKVYWPGNAIQAPEHAVAFIGAHLSVLGRVSSKEAPKKIKITGTLSGKKQEWSLPVYKSIDVDSAIPRLWARERIRDLEESARGLDSSVAIVKDKKCKQIVQQIIELSMEFQVMSSKASFVAIEERDDQNKTLDDAVTLRVPVPLTKGWGGTGKAHSAGVMYCSSDADFSLSRPMFSRRVEDASTDIRYSLSDDRTKYAEAIEDISEAEQDERFERAIMETIITDLLNLQKPSGGFEINGDAARYFKIEEGKLIEIANTIDAKNTNDEHKFLLLSTALVLAMLKIRYASDRMTWEPAVEKSVEWLMSECDRLNITLDGKPLEEWAEAYVRNLV